MMSSFDKQTSNLITFHCILTSWDIHNYMDQTPWVAATWKKESADGGCQYSYEGHALWDGPLTNELLHKYWCIAAAL